MTQIIILPYFSREEVERYLKIIDRIGSFKRPDCGFRFLLASSPKTEPDPELQIACEAIAPTFQLKCPTQIFGYPEGPSAMFWDAMDYIDENWGHEPGFSLWLESDMVPVDDTWMDQLSGEWGQAESPMLMGCYVPVVYKRRLFREWKFMLDEHVNGGACYAKNLASKLPMTAREGVFDMSVYPHAKEVGTVITTEKIAFSTLATARRDVLDPNKVLLHGFMQDKETFIDRCVAPVQRQELRSIPMIPTLNRIDDFKRHCRVWFFRFGHQAMFENMMLTKRQQSALNQNPGRERASVQDQQEKKAA